MHGYKKKPLLISILSLLYLLNPIGNILMLIFFNAQQRLPSESFGLLIHHVEKGNLLVIINLIFWITAIPLAIGLFRVKLWSWYLFLVHSVGMFILSFLGNNFEFHPTYASIVNFVFLIPIGFFISKELRTPYFNPRLRWWEQNKRFKEQLEIYIAGVHCTTYDISKSGVFILDDNVKYEIGKKLTLTINLKDARKVEKIHSIVGDLPEGDKRNPSDFRFDAFAEVVWVNQDQKKHPVGFGVRFSDMDRVHHKILDIYIRYLYQKGDELAR